MSVDLVGLHLANPTMLASGILGYSAEMIQRIVEGGAAAIVTKSIGAKSRNGYANPTLVQAQCGLINAMGLPNPGVDHFVPEVREAKKLKVPVIVSIYGFSAGEYTTVATKVTGAGADAVELNVSCPHVEATGSEIGECPDILREVTARVKTSVKVPVFVKLTPNVTDIAEMAEISTKAGADAITAVNTVKAMAIDLETTIPILSNRRGGLSGPAMKPIAIRCVYDIFERVKIPIIGCGGVTTWQDAVEFMLAGASAVQVGTAIALEGPNVFRRISRGVQAYMRKKQLRSLKEIVGLSHRR